MRISDWSSDVCSSDHGKLYGGRIQVRWTPAENLDIVAGASIEVNKPNDSAYTPYGSDSDVANYRVRNFNTDNTKIFSLNAVRSEEHTSELQSLMRISYAVFCLKKTKYSLSNN